MASTHSSPASSREASPAPMLTPRSKIRALLATVQSSDDEANTPTKKSKPTASIEDDSDSDVAIRPRGKLAARMHGAASTSLQQSNKSNSTEDARERVRKMLQLEQSNKEATELDVNAEADADAGDEDDDLPAAPRRLKRRVARESTPEMDMDETVSKPVSPGLFVSPAKEAQAQGESDSEVDLPAIKSDRFKALVARKRQERLAREAAEEAKKAERREKQEKLASELSQFDSDVDGFVDSITDDEGGRKLSQTAPPKRKASKRAMMEMEQETQRLARNMQLAHEAKTRKKITKSSLFDRFNYRPANEPEPAPIPEETPAQLPAIGSSSRPTTPPSDDDADMKDSDTPPSSPPSAKTANAALDAALSIPNVQQEATNPTEPATDKGKGKMVTIEEPEKKKALPRVRVRLPSPKAKTLEMDSDDDLEITVTEKDKLNAIFDNIPQKKSRDAESLQVFRALGQVRSPKQTGNRRNMPVSKMTTGELHASLQQRARMQAKLERDRRMETLKAQGIEVQTIEERERQEAEVEDLVAKAREEAQRLMKQERDEDRKAKKESGAADPLAWDDSDEEYEDSANEADGEGDGEASAIELSGSEGEDAEDEEDDEQDDTIKPMFEEEAEEDEEDAAESESEQQKPEDDDAEDETFAQPTTGKRRRVRNAKAVLSDDEVEMTVEATPRSKMSTHIPGMQATDNSPVAPNSVLRSAKKTFIPGLPVTGPAGLGLTQIFAGTMDNSQMSPSGPTQSMMPDFDHFPDSNFSATMDEPMEEVIEDSQRETQGRTQGVVLSMSQSQMLGLDSMMRQDLQTQPSQGFEPSQDGGLQAYTPLRDRFIDPPQSTIDTVIASGQVELDEQASPLVRRGRLRRKMDAQAAKPEELARIPEETAFTVMKDRAAVEEKRRLAEEFNRKKSKAKGMVEEQAQESEDEYAGLGGADGEDSDDESTASVNGMIDDEAGNNVNDSQLAAFYADRERAADEKAVEKLFKDITTGNLRRKRGADYDLSDSDDGGEARRRMKRRQFAKMQQALFADERVKKMAGDPGNQAFLRTIEDRGSDDEIDMVDVMEPEEQEEDSESPAQSQDVVATQQRQIIPDSQPREALASAPENRAPANLRRTKSGRKPSNIGEVRETLSNLLEERQDSVIPATEAGSDSEEEDPVRSDKENLSPRRRNNAVVDRISLKRTNSNLSTSSTGRQAFAASASGAGGFKVPMLLRRATTNSSLISSSSSSTKTGDIGSGGGFGEDAKLRKTASKKSGVVRGVTREIEGHAKLKESERRREARKVRGAEKRVGMVGGLLGRGSFA